jgi:DNA-binding XRE family transcriptional regulator
MALPIRPTRREKQERSARAAEWKQFRRDFLFSQSNLAEALKCSRRTVTSVESGREVVQPSYALLRRFNELKLKCEEQLRAIERRTKVA